MSHGNNNIIDLTSFDDGGSMSQRSTIQHIPGIGYAGSSSRSDHRARYQRQNSSAASNPILPQHFAHIPARTPTQVVDLTKDHNSQNYSQSRSSRHQQPSRHDTGYTIHSTSSSTSNTFDEMTGGALGTGASSSKNFTSTVSSTPENRGNRGVGTLSRRVTKQYGSRSTTSPLPQDSPKTPTGASIPMPGYASRSLTDSPKNSNLRQTDSFESLRRNGNVKSLLGPGRQAQGPESTSNSSKSSAQKAAGPIGSNKKENSPFRRSPPVNGKPSPPRSPRNQVQPTSQRSSWQKTVLRSPIENPLDAKKVPRPESPTSTPTTASTSTPTTVPTPVPAPTQRKPDLTIKSFRKVWDDLVKEIRLEHDYFVRSKLRRARDIGRGIPTKPSELESTQDNSQINYKRWKHEKSPFISMEPLPIGPRVSGSQLAINLGHYFLRQGKPSELVSSYQRTNYEDDCLAVPPYTNYISTKRNILVEDDKHRTFIPYLGEEPQLDPDYIAIENKISRNAQNYDKLNELTSKANQYVPFVEETLLKLGTDIDSVLNYLLNAREPSKTSTFLKALKYSREDFLQYGYYSQSDDSDTIKGNKSAKKKRPQRQYRRAQKSISKVFTQEKIDRAALACSVFMECTGFSLWHVVKHAASPTTPNKSPPLSAYSLSTYVDLGCLICKGHECPGHGEYEDEKDQKNLRVRVNHREYAKDLGPSRESSKQKQTEDLASTVHDALGLEDDGSVSGLPWGQNFLIDDDVCPDSELCSDDCFWSKANRKKMDPSLVKQWKPADILTLRTLQPAYDNSRRGPCIIYKTGLVEMSCLAIFYRLFASKAQGNNFSFKTQNIADEAHTGPLMRRPLDYWLDFDSTYMHHNREPFIPCNHPGPCDERSDCECYKLGITCEKSCACSDTCMRKFKGCQCHARNRACLNNDNCECARLNRECDPDLCRSCGAHEVLDPVNRNNRDILQNRCSNVYIQRGVPKRTLLGHSKMMADGGRSGWGLYMGEPCRKGEYVGEYVGEVVTTNEADQRGIIYDKRNLSYLFDVNKLQTLDSTLVGNKLRFINHQPKGMANVEPHTTFCNTVQRMGMFACKDIAVGEELFFDYGENFASKFNLIKLNHNAAPTIEKGKRDLPIRYTKHLPKTPTYSKNGYRIGRPPKYDWQSLGSTNELSPLSVQKPNTAKQNRKRRFSTLDGATDEVEDSESGQAESEGPAGPGIPSPGQMSDGDDEESDFDSDVVASSRRHRKKQRKRRSDFGVKKGPRPKRGDASVSPVKFIRTGRKSTHG